MVLFGCRNRRSLQPFHFLDEFSHGLVPLVEDVGEALVDDAPYPVGGRARRSQTVDPV